MTANAIVARRRLARGLRRYRQRSGKTLETVAAELECSVAKVSRMETGISGIRIQDVRALAPVVGLRPHEEEDMIELVRRARGREWWHDYADLVSADASTFFGLEDGAATIRLRTTSLMPGLMQTRAYAAALFSPLSEPPEVQERRLELRMRRQQLFDRTDPEPPKITAVLDEAVLHRQIGGRQVMAEQLAHLLHRVRTSGLDVRVIPFTAPTHPAEGASFTIFGFDHVDLAPVVYSEQPGQASFIDEPVEVRRFEDALKRAEQAALAPAASIELVERRIAELSR